MATSVDVAVGQRIRVRRMFLKMSQTVLAERAGITFQQIQKYEKGINRVGASRLYELAQILDVPVAFFFDDLANPGNGSSFDVKDLVSKESLELHQYFNKVPPPYRKAVLNLVRALSENDH